MEQSIRRDDESQADLKNMPYLDDQLDQFGIGLQPNVAKICIPKDPGMS